MAAYELTEQGTADRLLQRIEARFWYLLPLRDWTAWDGYRFSRELGRELLYEELDKMLDLWPGEVPGPERQHTAHHCRLMGSQRARRGVIDLLEKTPALCRGMWQFDHEAIFNGPHGITDLKTGEIREREPATAVVHRCNPFSASATPPEDFPDAELIDQFYAGAMKIDWPQLLVRGSLLASDPANLFPHALDHFGDYAIRVPHAIWGHYPHRVTPEWAWHLHGARIAFLESPEGWEKLPFESLARLVLRPEVEVIARDGSAFPFRPPRSFVLEGRPPFFPRLDPKLQECLLVVQGSKSLRKTHTHGKGDT